MNAKQKQPKYKIISGNDDRPPKFGKTYTEEEEEIKQLMHIKKYFQQKKMLNDLEDDKNNIQQKLNIISRAYYEGLIPSSSVIHTPNISAGGLTKEWIMD